MKTHLWTTLKCLGVVVVVLAILYVVLLVLSYQSLQRAYAALEADGRPLAAEQIIPGEVPDAENASLVYEAVVKQLKAEPAGEQNLFVRLDLLAGEMQKEHPDLQAAYSFRQLIGSEPAVEALAELEQALSKAGCRYDHDYSLGAELLLPHVGDLMNLSRILSAAARAQVDAGELVTAWDTVITGLHLADALREEPLLISQLARIAQFNMMVEAMQHVVSQGRPSAAQREEMIKRFTEFEDMTPYVRALDGERIFFGEWVFKNAGLVEEGISQPLLLYSYAAPFMMYDHAAYLTFMHDRTRKAQAPFSADDAAMDDALEDISRFRILTRLLVPALSAAKSKYGSMVAQAKVARAGLAVLHYHETEGRYPAALDLLNQSGLEDPFGGKLLVYQPAPGGFTLYSIGENFRDDGGISAVEKGTEDDLVWWYAPRGPNQPKR